MGMTQDELRQWRETSAWAYIYISLVTDAIELSLILLTIGIAVMQLMQSKHRQDKAIGPNFSKSIWL